MASILSSLSRWLRLLPTMLIQRIQWRIVTVKRSYLLSPSTQPNLFRTLSNKHSLYQSRIFIPRNQGPYTTAGVPIKKLPLVVTLHGGGFMMNNPSTDDPFSRYLSDRVGCLVVGIDYAKAPLYPFPQAYEDVVAQTLALLGKDGEDLPVDSERVVVCGFSAGGNLALGSVQDKRLQGRVLGVVGIYPVANMVPSTEEQLSRRPDPTVPDFLGEKWNDALDIYAGTTDVEVLKDPRMSPGLFKDRDDLPRNVYLVGCEHDMLCYETKIMAERIQDAGGRKPQRERGNVQWTIVEGQRHAFDQFPEKDQAKEKVRVKEKDKLWEGVAEWCVDVFRTEN